MDGVDGRAGVAAPRGQPGQVPVVAVVGRPNVGKSTLVNRILGSRQAVVEGTPGVTRDRVAYDATWNGRAFTLVDTGGWEPSIEGSGELAARVAAQARLAVDAADLVLFVADATTGVTDTDAAVATVLRRSGKPVVVAANKVDDAAAELSAASLWSLGLGEPLPVSALHGRGSGDLLDAVLAALPSLPPEPEATDHGPRRVALIGRPNVGKSSLLNSLAAEERALVHPVPGTTRDPVDELIELGGRTWRFIDTAGIRRRARAAQGADYFAALRTQRALERAEVAVVLIDASVPLTEQDLRITSLVIEAGRALVLAFNKWDLVDADRRYYLEREIDRELHAARWSPRVNVSAATGWHTDRLVPALDTALAGWETRVPTGRLNAWLSGVTAATPPPARGGRQPKILFATQAATAPPRFVLFSTGFLEASYRRFLERRLREEFGFTGSPVHLTMRIRQRQRPAARTRRASRLRPPRRPGFTPITVTTNAKERAHCHNHHDRGGRGPGPFAKASLQQPGLTANQTVVPCPLQAYPHRSASAATRNSPCPSVAPGSAFTFGALPADPSSQTSTRTAFPRARATASVIFPPDRPESLCMIAFVTSSEVSKTASSAAG
jgi:GTP-binding protein